MLRYLTAGQSHGRCLVAIIDDVPCGLELKEGIINKELSRRQGGYGRGGRMKIERDKVQLLCGVSPGGKTTGAPITLLIENKDWRGEGNLPPLTRPRPGHADLAGVMKYGQTDIRPILERASARETAARTAVGAVAISLLVEFGIGIVSYVTEIGGIRAAAPDAAGKLSLQDIDKTPLRCPDKDATGLMLKKIEEAKLSGDSLGGIFELVIRDAPPGLGSYVHWDRKLDGRLAGALMSIQAIKSVEIGLGVEASRRSGSKTHDEILYTRRKGFFRKSNNAGGLEGGMTNGEDIILRCGMKPISTLKSPLRSVDIITKEAVYAEVERADVCAVPAASVIGEGVCAIEIAKALQEKFGADTLTEMKRNFAAYCRGLRK